MTLGNLAREELLWWIENLKLCNWRKIQQRGPHMIIETDASTKGLGAYCKGVSTGGVWSKKEKHFHINILELLLLKFAILTFTKNFSYLTIHVQIDNKVALAYLLKMGGTRSPQLLKIRKSIWNYLLSRKITITAEYLPSRLNVRADWESRNATDSSDWKLHQKVFLKITKVLVTQQ